MFDARLACRRGGDQRHILSDLGEDHRRLFQDPLDAMWRGFEGLLDGPPDGGRGGLGIHQEIDEVAIAAVGRDPACRGVRLLQVARADQVGELVADGCRGKRDEVLGRQHLRADRDPGHGVVRDDGFQDLLLALVEGSGFHHVGSLELRVLT